MRSLERLDVWKRSQELVKLTYEVAGALLEYERYGLASQIRRSSTSIPSNLAEGSGRHSRKEFARFVNIPLASALELETQLRLVQELDLVAGAKTARARGEALGVRRMLASLHTSLLR